MGTPETNTWLGVPGPAAVNHRPEFYARISGWDCKVWPSITGGGTWCWKAERRDLDGRVAEAATLGGYGSREEAQSCARLFCTVVALGSEVGV